eukprot:2811666-Prymnesium_polylepis.2
MVAHRRDVGLRSRQGPLGPIAAPDRACTAMHAMPIMNNPAFCRGASAQRGAKMPRGGRGGRREIRNTQRRVESSILLMVQAPAQ